MARRLPARLGKPRPAGGRGTLRPGRHLSGHTLFTASARAKSLARLLAGRGADARGHSRRVRSHCDLQEQMLRALARVVPAPAEAPSNGAGWNFSSDLRCEGPLHIPARVVASKGNHKPAMSPGSLLAFNLRPRNRRAIFPVRRLPRLVTVQLTKVAQLRLIKGRFQLAPMVLAGSRQRLGNCGFR
jgi:hypothetical protein